MLVLSVILLWNYGIKEEKMGKLNCLLRTAVVTVMLLLVAESVLAAQVRISVAASMTDLFKNLIQLYTTEHPGVQVVPNFGPSGGLAKQIDQGAPADLYVSANPKWLDYLLENKKIDPKSKTIFAHNSLVFVGRTNKPISSLEDLAGLTRIGMGSPKSVPAGQYARQALEKTGLYSTLLAGGKLVMAKDVRQALIYADRGETDGSFVYKTDALLAENAKILFEVPADLYSKVTYPLALTPAGAEKKEVRDFYDYVISKEAEKSIIRYGFTLPQ